MESGSIMASTLSCTSYNGISPIPVTFLHACVFAKSLQSFLTLCDPWTIVCQASLSMEFSRQEYWSALPFPTPEDLPDPGIKLVSPALAGEFFTNCATWEAPVLMVPFT